MSPIWRFFSGDADRENRDPGTRGARFGMRQVTPHFRRGLVLAQPFIDHLAQQIVFGSG
jgi:hypothetical protein